MENSITLEQARALGEAGMAQAQDHAERDEPGFSQRAQAFGLQYLRSRGACSSEDITDACKQAGIVPDEDRAFGGIYATLRRRKRIEFAGYCERRKGHGTAGGRIWRIARNA